MTAHLKTLKPEQSMIRDIVLGLALLGLVLAAGGCGDGERVADGMPDEDGSAQTDGIPSTSDDSTPPELTSTRTPPGVSDVATLLKSEIERDPSPPTGGLEDLGAAMAELGFDLLRALHEIDPEENVLFSPVSLMYPLTMLWEGAQAPTRSELHSALRMRLEDEALHGAMNALERALARDTEDATLSIVNAIWLAERFEVNRNWLDVLARHYGSGVHLANFDDPAQHLPITQAINEWVESHTGGLIDRILSPNHLNPTTVVLILNALYLRDSWHIPFDPEHTIIGEAVFRTLDGNLVQADMMQNKAYFRYAEVEGVQAVSLQLRHLPVEALVVLPPEGDEATFLASLDATLLRILRNAQLRQLGEVQVPRLELNSEPEVYRAMHEQMEMAHLLEGGNYLGLGNPDIGGDQDAFTVSHIGQRAVLLLDEGGVEAAAASVVVGSATGSTGPPEDSFLFRADRPFLLLLIHADTDTPLFVSWVTDPRP